MFGEPVTRRRRAQSGTDRYGNPTHTTADVVLEERAGFAPKGSVVSLLVGREMVVTNDTLYFTEWPDLTDTDQVIFRGVLYNVNGRPADWRDPYGSDLGGLVVELEMVEG
jgi:hypothetical protein